MFQLVEILTPDFDTLAEDEFEAILHTLAAKGGTSTPPFRS